MKEKLDFLIKSDGNTSVFIADNEAVEKMKEAATHYQASEHDGNRLRIHLVLRNQGLADSFKRLPLTGDMADNIELYAYTAEDLWSMKMLGIHPGSTTRLDRQPMTADSRQFIHFVIFGASNQSESLAIHTVLTAHYPNYCRDNSLRTRITMIADSQKEFHHFQQRYRNLLVNSYRRVVEVDGDNVECSVLTPQYSGVRKDFVDIEWEFVSGRSEDAAIGYKLQKWAQDEQRQLTVAFCYDQDERNLTEALSLPAELLDFIPVWIRLEDERALDFMKQSERYARLMAFGMKDAVLPDLSVFIQLAQCVNFAYNKMRETSIEKEKKGLYSLEVAIDPPEEQELQQLWNNGRLTTEKRWSNIYNAFSLRTKMYSLGHPMEKWDTLFAISDKETESLSEVEHNRWCAEELVLGYRPTTEEEHARISSDISWRSKFKAEFKHDDLRNYHELGVDETGLPVARYDTGLVRTLPLLAYTYHLLQKNRHE